MFAGSAAAAERSPVPPPRELRRRTLTIDDRNVDRLPELHVAGASSTLLTFPVPLSDGGAVLADPRGLFYPLTQADRTLIIAPRADLSTPAALHVSLADGTVLSFKLASVPSEADAQVDVVLALEVRAARDSAPALRRALEACHGELDECRAGAVHAGMRELAALLAAAADETHPLDRHPLLVGDRQNGLLVRGSWVYRLVGFTFFVFRVENRDPTRSWQLDRAEVRLGGGGGEAVDVPVLAAVLDAPALLPGEAGRATVGFRTVPQALGQRFTMTLREKGGGRHVVLDGLSP